MAKVAQAVALIIAVKDTKKMKMKRKHRFRMREWLKQRQKHGALMKELDAFYYCNFMRMERYSFEELLNLVGPKITHKDTKFRDAIPPGERLAVTLRLLTTGQLIYISNVCIGGCRIPGLIKIFIN